MNLLELARHNGSRMAVAMVLAIVVVVVLAGMGVMRRGMAEPPGRQNPTPSVKPASPSTHGSEADAREIQSTARGFISAYLSYDWRQPADWGQSLRPYVDDRLYRQIVDYLHTPDGRAVPVMHVDPTAHEVDTVKIAELTLDSPITAPTASGVAEVAEDSKTDRGSSQTRHVFDLAFMQAPPASAQVPQPRWVVDYVRQRLP